MSGGVAVEVALWQRGSGTVAVSLEVWRRGSGSVALRILNAKKNCLIRI